MFDTMVFTKILGAFCGSLLVFLLINWAGEAIYHMPNANAAPAFVVDTGEDDAGGLEDAVQEEVAVLSFEEAYAMADANAGARVWNQCRACHALEAGRNGVGPYLHGVVDRPVGSAEGYAAYSGALSQVAEVWDFATLNAFLENPRGYAPGTTMSFNGLPGVQDRANLIAHIEAASQ
jgi:cytochrome c